MRMIFHVPFKLDPASAFANDIRPVKMLAAFRALGLDVDVVEGRSRERKARIGEIRRKIKDGQTYEFVYSECSPLPTALTDPSKRPTRPFLDHRFLSFCKSRGVRVGLFYRDVYWRFPNTGQYRSAARHAILAAFHLFDLLAYTRAVSRMYLPSIEMSRHIPFASRFEFSALPPGHDFNRPPHKRAPSDALRLLYVGGLGELYDLRTFMEVIQKMPNLEFTLCTRRPDWERERGKYDRYLGGNVTVVHEKGESLQELYAKADVAVFFLRPTAYSTFAVSIKVFEYIGNRLPIIAVEGTRVGSIVEQEGVGWTIPFEPEALGGLLANLVEHPEAIERTSLRLAEASRANTWIVRARAVAEDLSH